MHRQLLMLSSESCHVVEARACVAVQELWNTVQLSNLTHIFVSSMTPAFACMPYIISTQSIADDRGYEHTRTCVPPWSLANSQ